MRAVLDDEDDEDEEEEALRDMARRLKERHKKDASKRKRGEEKLKQNTKDRQTTGREEETRDKGASTASTEQKITTPRHSDSTQRAKERKDRKDRKERKGNGRELEFFERSRAFPVAHGGCDSHATGFDPSQVWENGETTLSYFYTRIRPAHPQMDLPHQESQRLFECVLPSLLSHPPLIKLAANQRHNDADKNNNKKKKKKVNLTTVRELVIGQKTSVFLKNRFPEYEHVSFSLVYDDRSLDIICKTREEFDTWVTGIRSILEGVDLSLPKEIAPQERSQSDRLSLMFRGNQTIVCKIEGLENISFSLLLSLSLSFLSR